MQLNWQVHKSYRKRTSYSECSTFWVFELVTARQKNPWPYFTFTFCSFSDTWNTGGPYKYSLSIYDENDEAKPRAQGSHAYCNYRKTESLVEHVGSQDHPGDLDSIFELGITTRDDSILGKWIWASVDHFKK